MRLWPKRRPPAMYFWNCPRCDYQTSVRVDSPGSHHMLNSRVFLHMGDHESGRIPDQFDGLRQGVDHQAEDQAYRENPDGKDGHPVTGLSGSLAGEQPLGRRSHGSIMPYDQTAQFDGSP